jgi:hypothetical protein
MTIDPIVALSIRIFLGGLFSLTVWHKLSDLNRFTQVIRSYFRNTLPLNSIGLYLIAGVVIACELSIAFSAVTMRSHEFLGASASTLLVLYAVAMGMNILRGNRLLDCGCSWGGDTPVSGLLVLCNLLLACGVLTLIMPIEARTLTTFEIANSAALAFCAYLIYLAVDQLINNHNLVQESLK